MKKFIALVIVALCFCACDDCDRGHYIACKELGDLYYEGEGVAQDFDKALNYHNKACELNTGSCFGIAYFYEKEKKYNIAISFFKKACDKNHIDSCSSLGWLYYYTQDFDKALNYHNKACELNTSSCISVGEFYEKEKKYNIAISVYEKACDKNHIDGCKKAGDLYYEGKGVAQDFNKALNYHKKACGLNTRLCRGFYLKEEKYNQAKYFAKLYYEVAEIACDKGNAEECNNLGFAYSNGQGVAKNTAKAKTFYEKSCSMNYALACQNAGYHYYNAKQFAKAKVAFEKGCGANLADSCSFLGILYEFGKGVRQDLSTAKSYYGKGCDGGSQSGCNGYKELNQRGGKAGLFIHNKILLWQRL